MRLSRSSDLPRAGRRLSARLGPAGPVAGSSRRELGRDGSGDEVDFCRQQLTVVCEALCKCLAVEQEMAAHRQGPQRREVCVGEAEDTTDLNIGVVGTVDRGADGRNLPVETVYQLGVVPTGDSQLCRPEQRLLYPDGAGVSLGVDHV